MTDTTISSASPSSNGLPTLIVLGRDGGGKAHASWFNAAEAPLAEQAAATMGMAALGVAADEIKALAGHLPQGRVFASGRAFVPFVKGALYDALASHLPPGFQFPAKVAADPAPKGKPKQATTGSAPETGPVRPLPVRPQGWDKIEVGNLVLATEGAYEGWFEAQVVKVSPEGLYTLRWRDWLDVPVFTRRLKDIALLHPGHAG